MSEPRHRAGRPRRPKFARCAAGQHQRRHQVRAVSAHGRAVAKEKRMPSPYVCARSGGIALFHHSRRHDAAPPAPRHLHVAWPRCRHRRRHMSPARCERRQARFNHRVSDDADTPSRVRMTYMVDARRWHILGRDYAASRPHHFKQPRAQSQIAVDGGRDGRSASSGVVSRWRARCKVRRRHQRRSAFRPRRGRERSARRVATFHAGSTGHAR